MSGSSSSSSSSSIHAPGHTCSQEGHHLIKLVHFLSREKKHGESWRFLLPQRRNKRKTGDIPKNDPGRWSKDGFLLFRVFKFHLKRQRTIHPGRLTWNIIIGVWKIIFLSKWVICMFHVNLPGCSRSILRTILYNITNLDPFMIPFHPALQDLWGNILHHP